MKKRINKLKTKKYQNGGKFGDIIGDIKDMNINDAGQLAGNYGKSILDSSLSTVGLSNIIPDTAYKGAGADIGRTASNITGKIGQMALPIALQTAGVPMAATKAAQQGLGMLNPQEEQQFPFGGIYDATIMQPLTYSLSQLGLIQPLPIPPVLNTATKNFGNILPDKTKTGPSIQLYPYGGNVNNIPNAPTFDYNNIIDAPEMGGYFRKKKK